MEKTISNMRKMNSHIVAIDTWLIENIRYKNEWDQQESIKSVLQRTDNAIGDEDYVIEYQGVGSLFIIYYTNEKLTIKPTEFRRDRTDYFGYDIEYSDPNMFELLEAIAKHLVCIDNIIYNTDNFLRNIKQCKIIRETFTSEKEMNKIVKRIADLETLTHLFDARQGNG